MRPLIPPGQSKLATVLYLVFGSGMITAFVLEFVHPIVPIDSMVVCIGQVGILAVRWLEWRRRGAVEDREHEEAFQRLLVSEREWLAARRQDDALQLAQGVDPVGGAG